MVCFVHDRQSLSKFHAIVNQLRQTNQFTVMTLIQLPSRCCSCPEKQKDIASTGKEPLLTSLDFDALQLICLQLDLKQCIETKATSSSTEFPDYIILPFPVSYESKNRTMVANQFINRPDQHQYPLQCMPDIRLEYVTSYTPAKTIKDLFQHQYDLVVTSSNYSEAKQIIDSLWVLISGADQAKVAIVKATLQRQWELFLTNISQYYIYPVDNKRRNLPQLVTSKTWLSRRRPKNRQQKMLEKQKAKSATRRPKIPFLRTNETDSVDFENEDYHSDADLVDDVLASVPARLEFLYNRFENGAKNKRVRTHRRQHILALALAA